MVHDAVSQHEGSVLSTESFRVEIEERASVSHGDAVLRHGTARFADDLPEYDQLPRLKEVEHLMIAEALKRADGNQTIAARLLGMSKQTLNSRLRRARKRTIEA